MRKILRDEDWDNVPKFEALLRFDQVGASTREAFDSSFSNLCSQLRKAMDSKKAFSGFQELPITISRARFLEPTVNQPTLPILGRIVLVPA